MLKRLAIHDLSLNRVWVFIVNAGKNCLGSTNSTVNVSSSLLINEALSLGINASLPIYFTHKESTHYNNSHR